MSPTPDKPERGQTDFLALPQAPTDFDRTPAKEPAAPRGTISDQTLLWIQAACTLVGAGIGALAAWGARGHEVTSFDLRAGAMIGAVIAFLLAFIAVFRNRRKEKDAKFDHRDIHADDDWAGAREVLRKKDEPAGGSSQ
jgi:hypothetical protein